MVVNDTPSPILFTGNSKIRPVYDGYLLAGSADLMTMATFFFLTTRLYNRCELLLFIVADIFYIIMHCRNYCYNNKVMHMLTTSALCFNFSSTLFRILCSKSFLVLVLEIIVYHTDITTAKILPNFECKSYTCILNMSCK